MFKVLQPFHIPCLSIYWLVARTKFKIYCGCAWTEGRKTLTKTLNKEISQPFDNHCTLLRLEKLAKERMCFDIIFLFSNAKP